MSERADLITSYLLGELDPDRVAEVEAMLASDDDARREAESLRPLIAELERAPEEAWIAAADLPPLEPPPIPAAETAGARQRHRARPWWRPVLVGVGAALLIAIGIAIGTQIGDDSGSAEPQLVLSPLEGTTGATATVRVGADGNDTAELVVNDLPPSAGKHYELWLLRDDADPVSLGPVAVDPSGHADTVVQLPVNPGSYDSFDISVEPNDGDPAHSGDSVLRGPSSSS